MPQNEPSRLDALADRRRTVRISPTERAYSSFVKKLRWFLPIAALGIVGILMVWPKIQVEIAERRFGPSPLDRAALEQAATENRLLNAQFSSVDAKGRPFSVNAQEAIQENNNPDNIILQNPKGTLKLDSGQTLTAESKHGIYAQTKQHLNLMDDVVLTRSDGTVMTTQILFVDLMTNDSHTDQPVAIDGPQGHLRAQNMNSSGGGAITIFGGPATLTLNAKSTNDPKGGS